MPHMARKEEREPRKRAAIRGTLEGPYFIHLLRFPEPIDRPSAAEDQGTLHNCLITIIGYFRGF